MESANQFVLVIAEILFQAWKVRRAAACGEKAPELCVFKGRISFVSISDENTFD